MEGRKLLIQAIENDEEKERKEESLRQVEIFNDRLHQHVYGELDKTFSSKTLLEMPIISSINLARRITKQEASIYKEAPARTWSGLTEEQEESVANIYNCMKLDSKLQKSNESFKLQKQNHVMIIPKNGKLVARSLRNHHVTSIPNPDDPEEAIGYVLTSFDKGFFLKDYKRDPEIGTFHGDGVNQKIGDKDDYKMDNKRYVVWTKDHEENGEKVAGLNFIMNGKGELISGDDIKSPLAGTGLLPIINIAQEQDFEYWVRQGEAITEFTIEYNVILSWISQVVKMQGFSQAFLKGPASLKPENIVIGPNNILMLPTDPGTDQESEFGFATPGADIAGSMSYVEMILSNFLSSRGIDPKTITGKAETNRFSSGSERLLSMLEKFDATKEDFSTYEWAEGEIWNLIKTWLKVLQDDDKGQLEDRFKIANLPEDSTVSVVFNRPELIQTEQEKVTMWTDKMEQGFASRVDALMDLNNLTRESAIEKADQIDMDELNGDRPEQSDEAGESRPL